MATKTITIMEDVYNLLRAARRGKESYSDILRRQLKRERSILDFAGAWENVSDEEIDAIKREIRLLRRRGTKKLFEQDREERK